MTLFAWLMVLFGWSHKDDEPEVSAMGFGEFGSNGSVHIVTNASKRDLKA